MKLKEELLKIARSFELGGIDYALCGGLAVGVHGYPRFTKDIDLLIMAEDLERAREELLKLEYDLEGGLIRFNPGTNRECQLFRVSRAVGSEWLTLDLLLVTEVYKDVWATREVIQLGQQTLKVVSKAGLITMKQIGGRPQDLADIAALTQVEE